MARILIIDDEEEIRDVLSLLLTGVGHSVVVAKDGFEGMQLFRAAPADVVLCDIVMPYGGIATIRVLRSEYPGVGIIAMSGASQRRLNMSVDIGANEILGKPFSTEHLLEAIAKALPKGSEPVQP